MVAREIVVFVPHMKKYLKEYDKRNKRWSVTEDSSLAHRFSNKARADLIVEQINGTEIHEIYLGVDEGLFRARGKAVVALFIRGGGMRYFRSIDEVCQLLGVNEKHGYIDECIQCQTQVKIDGKYAYLDYAL